ncbi:MAG: hypothetical protein WCI92_04045 [Bacteroidota bacterium]
MKKLTFISVLIVSFLFARAQNANLDYKYAVKAYNLASYYTGSILAKISDSSDITFTTDDLKILHLSLAFQWQNKKKNFHELELTSFELGKLSNQDELSGGSGSGNTIPRNGVISTNIAFRYEYIVNFNKAETRKLVPSIGFGGSPYYRLYKYEVKYEWQSPLSQQFIGFSLFATPRLSYYLSSRVFFDMNIPICVFDFNYMINKLDVPFLELSERTTSVLNINMFPKILSGRIGIGLKL